MLIKGQCRKVTWQRIDVAGTHALRIEQVEPNSTYEVFTRVTITWSEPGSVIFRLLLGVGGGKRLVPAEIPVFRPPGIVGDLLSSSTLNCSTLGQQVDNRYIMIKDSPSAELLADLVDNESRLPLIILNTSSRWAEVEQATRSLAQTVGGLARVVCLAWVDGATRFRNLRPDRTPALGEAMLIWPSRQLPVEPFDLNEPIDGTPLMGRLLNAAVTVFGGQDEEWRSAEYALRDLENQRLRARIADATDIDAVRSAAEAQMASKEGEIVALRGEYEDLLQLAFHETDAMRTQRDDAQSEIRRLKGRLYLQVPSTPDEDSVQWSSPQMQADVDCMELSSMCDVVRVLEELEKRTGGAIIFTDNAREVCQKGSYPEPARMAAHLVLLAGAAVEYRATSGRIGSNLHQWLKQQGLANSTLDNTLVKEKLHHFTFDGRTLDRTPHVKVDDHTHPDRVGRIYFAADHPRDVGARFVVDHVGQKLYLIEGKRIRKGHD